MPSSSPVSYTHLDVYKRQTLISRFDATVCSVQFYNFSYIYGPFCTIALCGIVIASQSSRSFIIDSRTSLLSVINTVPLNDYYFDTLLLFLKRFTFYSFMYKYIHVYSTLFQTRHPRLTELPWLAAFDFICLLCSEYYGCYIVAIYPKQIF